MFFGKKEEKEKTGSSKTKKRAKAFDNDIRIATKLRFYEKYGLLFSFCRHPFSYFERYPLASFSVGIVLGGFVLFLFFGLFPDLYLGYLGSVPPSFSNILNIFSSSETVFLFVLFSLFLPFLYFEEKRQKRIESAEFRIPSLLMDLSNLIAGGLTLQDALAELTAFDARGKNQNDSRKDSRKNQDIFLQEFRLIGLKMKSGLPFEFCLNRLGERYDSKLIQRAASVIEAAEKSGGRPELSIDAAAYDLMETVNAKKERAAQQAVHGTVLFLSFFLFIGVSVLLISQFQAMNSILSPGNAVSSGSVTEAARFIWHMLLIQAFFSGLMVGKFKKGKVAAGLKYSFGLMFVVWAVFSSGGFFV